MNEVTSPKTKERAGLLESAMDKLLMRTAQVVDIEDVGTAFRVVTRVDWAAEDARTRILVHLQAGGPGAHGAHMVRTGRECNLGPVRLE
jgi:ferric-chelate reductase (NADPH)